MLTARGVAHLVVHGTSGSTSYETIPRVRLESSGGVLSTVDMVVQRRDGPREHDDDDNTGRRVARQSIGAVSRRVCELSTVVDASGAVSCCVSAE